MSELTHIGFIGLGQMGAPMAKRLLGPDTTLHVHDRASAAMEHLVAAGAVGHASAAAVADAAPLVFACLPSPAISEAVALGPDGIIAGAAIRTYVEMSTVGRQCVERIAAGLAARNIGFVDAPISGGPPGARAGTLAVMASGAPDAIALAESALRRIGRSLHVLGDRPGLGQTMKLVNNLVIAANMASTFEALVLGAKAGLDADAMVAVLNASTGRSLVTTDIVPRSVLTRSFDFGATIAIMEKDVRLGLAEAAALSVPMWTLEQAARLWTFAVTQGRAADDISALIRVMEEWAGTTVGGGQPPA